MRSGTMTYMTTQAVIRLLHSLNNFNPGCRLQGEGNFGMTANEAKQQFLHYSKNQDSINRKEPVQNEWQ